MSEVVDIHKKDGKRPHYDKYVGRAVKDTEFKTDSKWCKPHGMPLKKYEPYIRQKLKKIQNITTWMN